jgi:hypothetical protein
MRASAFGIFQVTLFSVSSSTAIDASYDHHADTFRSRKVGAHLLEA